MQTKSDLPQIIPTVLRILVMQYRTYGLSTHSRLDLQISLLAEHNKRAGYPLTVEQLGTLLSKVDIEANAIKEIVRRFNFHEEVFRVVKLPARVG